VSIGAPAAGRLVNGVQVPEGEGYTAKLPESAYGTTHAVTHLVAGLAAFREQHTFEGDILLGSMSRRHGGPIGGHRSHQTGRDIDIRLPLRAGVPSWFPIRPWRVDWTAVWHLLVALIDTGEVQIVFMDYGAQKYLHRAAVALGVEEAERRRVLQWPIGYKAHRGIVRHAPGHTQHVHVRFRCGTFEPECVPESELPSGE
jgi:murein endopeptidase